MVRTARTPRNFLQRPTVGGVGVALQGEAAASGPVKDLTTLGMGPARTALENRNAFKSALSNSSDNFYLPPGDYLFDNTHPTGPDTPQQVDFFRGRLVFAPGARILFTTNDRAGVLFYRPGPCAFDGWNTGFQTLPPARMGARECFSVMEGTDVTMRSVRVDGSSAAGVIFYNSVRPRVYGAKITNTRADGLNFSNCQDGEASDIYTENTGDDGLAFINYAGTVENPKPDYTGGSARNIQVRGSLKRGITVVGQSDVRISKFDVRDSALHGVYVASESASPGGATRRPSRVAVEDGVVRDSTQNGIQLENVDTGVAISNVKVLRSGARGISGAGNTGLVTFRDIEIDTTVQAGVDFRNENTVFNGVVVRNSGDSGFVVFNHRNLQFENVTVSDAGGGLQRAIWVENPDTSSYPVTELTANAVNVVTTLATKAHSLIFVGGTTNRVRGVMSNVNWRLAQIPTGPSLLQLPGSANVNVSGVGIQQAELTMRAAAAPTTGMWATGMLVVNTGASAPYGWLCTSGGTPGTWKAVGEVPAAPQVVFLASDVANNNATANTYGDVTGLSFPVQANTTYRFKAVVAFDAAATTTGSRWSVNGPAFSLLAYKARWSLTATTEAITHANAYNAGAVSATSAFTTGNVAIIEGVVRPTAAGTFVVRSASEVASSAITAKAGSYLEIF